MKNVTLDSFIEDRIKENEKLFTKEELEDMSHNKGYVKKIYLLGLIHGKECYDKQDWEIFALTKL